MKIKAIYDTEEEIPSVYRDLYTERNGKYELTQVEGVKTTGDVDRLQNALSAERDAHKQTQRRLAGLPEGTGAEDYLKLKDENEDLRLRLESDGKKSEEETEELLEKRLVQRIRPLERDKERLEKQMADLIAERDQFRREVQVRDINGDVVKAVQTKDYGLNPDALPDIELFARSVMEVTPEGRRVTKDNCGVAPGLQFHELIQDFRASGQRPTWFKESVGAGATGGAKSGGFSGSNPFKGKMNLGEIAKMVQTSPDLAEKMAREAGPTAVAFLDKVKAGQ